MAAITTGTVSPSTFQWIIPNFRDCFRRPGDCIKSPEFHQADSSWCILLSSDSFGRQWIYLYREYYGPPQTITYSIILNDRSDAVVITKTEYFPSKGAHSKKRTIFLNETSSSLLITCYIKRYTPHPAAGIKCANRDVQRENSYRKSCATQTDVANLVIAKENPKHEDWSPLDMKGIECANRDVQRENSYRNSCATQTDVSNLVIAKENPKHENWSPLDMKGVALLSERMKDLLNKAIEPDLTICVQDKEFRAHRIILSARSPVFSMMLAHNTKENKTSTINIEDCDPESFDEFLLHVYSGRTENLTPSNALRLYYPADKYDFPVLKERCLGFLKNSLCVESICDVILLAAKHQEKELLEVATEFFARNVKKILVTVGWQKFMVQNPVEANEMYIKSMEILLPED